MLRTTYTTRERLDASQFGRSPSVFVIIFICIQFIGLIGNTYYSVEADKAEKLEHESDGAFTSMIRLGKPVRLLEWGEGTNTHNQTWTQIGEGVLHNKPKQYAGATTLVVEVKGPVTKKNEKNKSIKLLQPGEGMIPYSDYWGEVAMGELKSIENKSGKTVLEIEVDTATKLRN